MIFIKRLFKNYKSFCGQQRLAIMLACTIVLIISQSSSLLYDFTSFQRESRARLGAMAEIIASNVSSALVFDDFAAIEKSLDSMKGDPSIIQLFVINDQGRVVSYYERGSNSPMPDDVEQRLKKLGHGFVNTFFELSPKASRSIIYNDKKLGTILLELDSSIFLNKLMVSFGIGTAILLISMLGSYLLAKRLGQIVTDPILSLAATMDEISRTKDYRLRAEVSCVAELIHLASGFNEMLDEIARRDQALLERQESLHQLANYDTLTGLPNRAMFRDRLAQALRLSERSAGRLAVLFIDLDDFKLINDTHGHRVGDLLLNEVSRRLELETRGDETLARLGGDEFIIFLQNIKSAGNAMQVARKHLRNLLGPYLLEDNQLFISASIGIALYPEHGETAEILVKSADTAMYQAKEKGKNQIEFFTQALYSRVSERLSLQGDLRRALKNGEFVLHYQPRINLLTGKWSGVEALVRWQHPQHGLISPLTFIPLAEETGLIMQLGEWVLRNACRQLHRWHCEGINLARISVNVSPIQFRRQNIVELVKSAIREASLCTQALELEITESALMDNMEQAVSILRQLQNMGVNISIDDFGTGYSSLSHLRTLPVNVLKIDRSFLLNAHELKEDAQILSAIITMAHSLNLDVVAEGVECEEHEALLRAQGCREAQGFLYARPIPADELAHMLRQNSQSLQSISYRMCNDDQQTCCTLDGPCGDNSEVCLQVPYRPTACQGKIICGAGSAQIAA